MYVRGYLCRERAYTKLLAVAVSRQSTTEGFFLWRAVFQVSLCWICITFVIRKVIKRIFTCRNKNASKTILRTLWGILRVYLGPELARLLTVGLAGPETSPAPGRVFLLCPFSPAGLSPSSQKPKMPSFLNLQRYKRLKQWIRQMNDSETEAL